MEVREIRAFFEKRDQSMTKTFIINMSIGLCVFLLVGGIASAVSAQETETAENPNSPSQEQPVPDEVREIRQAELEEKKEERQVAVEEKKEERRAALSEKSADRILALANKISEKMLAAISRMEQIISRIEERVALMSNDGVETTSSLEKLSEAKRHLALATSIIETEVDDLVDEAVLSESPKENWVAAKTKYQEARESLRAAHTAIKEAVSLLKEATQAPAQETDEEAEDTEE